MDTKLKATISSLALCCAAAASPALAQAPCCVVVPSPVVVPAPPVSPPPGARAWVEVEPEGVDLAFTCFPHPSGDITYCSPLPGRYGSYVDRANWRMDHAVSMPGTCAYNQTYGYANQTVWVAGDCVARFMAPNLRYGDQFNHQRALRAFNPPPPAPSAPVVPVVHACCLR